MANSHFSVGECGVLIFIKGTVGKVFDPSEKWGKTVKTGDSTLFFSQFSPIFSLFSPIFPHFSPTLEIVPTFSILICS